jgi:signal transduction histidine kinase
LVDDSTAVENEIRAKIRIAENMAQMLYVAPSHAEGGTDEDERLPPVCDNRTLLRQVRANLVSEAIKFSRKGGAPRGRVSGTLEDGEAAFQVEESYRLGADGFVVEPLECANFSDAAAKVGTYWLLVNRSP